MRRFAPAVFAALSFAVVSCTDTPTPITQDQIDESLATTLSGLDVDPNAQTTGGHTATAPAATCSWNATTMWNTCTGTNNGLTITRQMQFLNAAGAPQQRPDSTTSSMHAQTAITGTTTFTNPQGGPTITTTVNRNSDETVTGLAKGSTQRVVNGTASGTENSTGTDSRGTVTIARTFADTTTNMTFAQLAAPPAPGTPVFPLSGTIKRYLYSSVKVGDGTPKTFNATEVHTFEAGGKVTIKTTVNGQTRTCVIQLGVKQAPTCTT